MRNPKDLIGRDPRDLIRGRVDARINREIYDQKLKARQVVDGQLQKVVNRGQGKEQGGKPGEKKKRMGWWPFGKKEEGGAAGSACPGCGKEVDPSWPMCPYCGTSLTGGAASQGVGPGGAAAGPLPVGSAPDIPIPASNRTMAIDLESLGAPKKPVRGWLVIVEGHQKGMDFRLYEGSNRIGAGADNDIVITDEYLSTAHAQVRVEGNAYEFIDNGSTNGSYVNDRRVSKEEIIDNDRIRLGRTEFRVKTLLEY